MTRILLAGSNKLLTHGLRALFERETDFTVVAVTELDEAGDRAKRLLADIVIADLQIQTLDTPAVIAQIRKQSPATKIVLLSISVAPVYVAKVMAAGASAFVLKSEPFDAVVHAIHDVTAGMRYLSPAIDAQAVAARGAEPNDVHLDSYDTLTEREKEVLKLAAEGRTSAQIAAALGISRRTVETHRANIYKKLLVEGQVDLIALALKHGLIARDV